MINKIITLEDVALRDEKTSAREWILDRCKESLRSHKINAVWDGVSIEGDAVFAFVNNGRWLARCKVCSTPIYVSWIDPILYCTECGNGGSTSAWPVKFPDDRERIEAALLVREVFAPHGVFIRNEIEEALHSRPRIYGHSRNWIFGISADELEKENVERNKQNDSSPY